MVGLGLCVWWVWVVYVVLFIDWGLGGCVIDVGYGGWVWVWG